MDIQGASVIITGGASGLGRASAELLAARGARVAILDPAEKAGREVAARIGGSFHAVDVTDEAAIAAALDAAEQAHGIARVLVNCAGYTPIERLVGEDGEPHRAAVFEQCLRVNLLGTLLVNARFAARLAQVEPLGEERGVIVNTASIAAFDGQSGMAAYAAAKAGVAGLTLPAARDLAPRAIRVVAIAPGMFRTPMVGMLTEEGKDRLGSQAPFPNRLGRPEEFALLVAQIVENPMLNGEVIRIDAAHRLRA